MPSFKIYALHIALGVFMSGIGVHFLVWGIQLLIKSTA